MTAAPRAPPARRSRRSTSSSASSAPDEVIGRRARRRGSCAARTAALAYSEAAAGECSSATGPARRVHGALPRGGRVGHRSRRAVTGPTVQGEQRGDRAARGQRDRGRDRRGRGADLLRPHGGRDGRGAATPTRSSSADPNVTPFEPWPDPLDGHRIRAYPLADVPEDSGRFGRMLPLQHDHGQLLLSGRRAARPAQAVAPPPRRLRADLAAARKGRYVHHIRTPWTVDMAHWRDDDHQRCSSAGRHDHPAAHDPHQPGRERRCTTS